MIEIDDSEKKTGGHISVKNHANSEERDEGRSIVSVVFRSHSYQNGRQQSSLEDFWSRDNNPRPLAARKLFRTPDDEMNRFVNAVARNSGYTVQQLCMASTLAKKNKAWKESRNVVLKIDVDPDTSHILSSEAILTKCANLGPPFDAIKAVQFPPLEMDRILLIVRSDLSAREIRMHEERLKIIINSPGCAVYSEEFHISPAGITRTEVDKMKTSKNKAFGNKDTRTKFKDPTKYLKFWKRETGLDIHRAYWKYGRLWFVLRNREEAQNAASGKMYTLEGLQTSFDSLDPKYVPKQCFNCQDFGHMAKQCPNKVRCGRCLKAHKTSECKAKEDKYKCFFCGGAHPSYWLRCCRHPRVLDVLHRCSLWRGRASWDTKRQEPEASGRSVSPGIPTDNESPRPGFGIQELLREILSDQGAATPDESLLSHALGRGGDILFRLIEVFVRVAAGNLGPTLPNNSGYHAPQPRRASPSPSVLSTHSRLGTVTGDLSLANSPRASARDLYDYANRSPSRQTPSPDGSLYGSGWNSNGASPARQVSVEPPFSSYSELSDVDLFMDTFEDAAQQEVFELSADCPVESIFELSADHPLYPEGHKSPAVAQQAEDTCDMVPSDSAPEVSLDGLPELSRDMIAGIISIPSTPIGSEGEVDWDFIPDTPPGLLTCAVTADEPKAVEAACDSPPETSAARKRRRSSSTATGQSSSAVASQVCPEEPQQPLAVPPSSPEAGSSSAVVPCSLPDSDAASQPPEGPPPAESSSVGSLSVRKRRWRPDEDLDIFASPISVKKLRVEDSLVQDGCESALAALSPTSPTSGPLTVTSTVVSDEPFPTNSDSSLLLQANPSTPTLRRSRRGVQPSFTPGSSTASSSSRSSSGSSFVTVGSSLNTSGLLESPANSSHDPSEQLAGDDSSPVAGTSQSSVQIAPRESTRVLRPRRGLTDDDEIAAQLERDASQASPSDQELLQHEIGPESAAASGEEDGSDDEYSPGRKQKARSKRKSKIGSRGKGKGIARETPDTGPKQTKLDRYFS
ncbi:reverse transcriptase [Fusarium bulbicola]|nr:reverse transcriptase [Fusarium bulbicola]